MSLPRPFVTHIIALRPGFRTNFPCQYGIIPQSVRPAIAPSASGGIRDLGDIKALKEMGLYGAICGKSIYSGTLSLREALAETCEG